MAEAKLTGPKGPETGKCTPLHAFTISACNTVSRTNRVEAVRSRVPSLVSRGAC